MEIEKLYELYKSHPLISTDTRNILPGSIFFALKGGNFNGNDFAIDAIEKGAAYAVVDEVRTQKNEKLILVEDVLTALQDLARFHRNMLQIPFIGITGSNGKTTTKELVNAVLAKKYSTFATKGNLNNHIGVPLTILSINEQTEIAIIEMGANHQKEIELLCSICKPNYGLITNIGKAHLEGFGGVEGIKKGKGELYDFIKGNGGKIFLNVDSEVLLEMASNAPIIAYGSSSNCYLEGNFFAADPFVRMTWKCNTKGINDRILETSIVGKYNYSNILAALCIGNFFDVEPDAINAAIAEYVPDNNRSQVIKTTENTIILDAYNANPSSMEEALKNFAQMDAPKKVFILGDMLELGSESAGEHESIAQMANEIQHSKAFLVGPNFMGTSIEFEKFSNSDELKHYLIQHPIKGCTILIKGSRGIRLEKITEVL
jgi:UDP-N-acetylmuramoyl-tripeptide--D-alanyl-D-alanine ligase